MTTPKLVSHHARELIDVLFAYVAIHEQLLALTREHRVALAGADGGAIGAALERQHILRAALGSLDTRRIAVTAALSPARRGITLAELAALLPAPAQAEAGELAERLRALLIEIQRESGVIQRASRTLIAHVDGIMQGIARSLDRARMYGPAGRIAMSRPAVCGVDLSH